MKITNQVKRILGDITKFNEPIVFFATSLPFRPADKYLSDAEYVKKYRAYYKSLDPHLWVTNTVKQFQKEHKFADYFMVGIHYRSWSTGKADDIPSLTIDKEHRYINDFINAINNAAATPLSQTDQKPVAFFLATDDPKIKEKIQAIPGLKNRIFTRNIPIDRSTIYEQESALVDWFLLGSTNYIIGTYQSSFSDEAAHLTKQNRKIDIGNSAFK